MRYSPTVWFSFISVVLLTLNASPRSYAGEAVILAESTELRTADKTLGLLRRGELVSVSQTSGSFRLVEVAPLKIERPLNILGPPKQFESIDIAAESVQAWVRLTDLFEFGITDGVDAARRAFHRAKDFEKQGEWESACRDFVIAYRLFESKKGSFDEETVASGKSLGWALVANDVGDAGKNHQDGFSLLVNLSVRLNNNPIALRKQIGVELMDSIKAKWIEGTLRVEAFSQFEVAPNDAQIGDDGVQTYPLHGQSIRLDGKMPVVILERFPDFFDTVAGDSRPGSLAESSNETARKRSEPKKPEETSPTLDETPLATDELLPTSLPDGHIFVRLTRDHSLCIVPETSVIRRRLPADVARLASLPAALHNERGNSDMFERVPLRTDLSREEDKILQRTIIDLVVSIVGTEQIAFVGDVVFFRPDFGIFETTKPNLDALRQGIQTFELVLHPCDPRLASASRKLGIELLNHDFDEAQHHLRRAASIRKRLVDFASESNRAGLSSELGESLMDLGELELTLGDLGKARKHISEGLKLMRANSIDPDTSLSWLVDPFVKRFSALGDARTALDFEKEVNAASKSGELGANNHELPGMAAELNELPLNFQPSDGIQALRLWRQKIKGTVDFTPAQFRSAIPPLGSLNRNIEEIASWSIALYISGHSSRAREYFNSISQNEWQSELDLFPQDAKTMFGATDSKTVAAGAAVMMGFSVGHYYLELRPDDSVGLALSFAREVTGREATLQFKAILETGGIFNLLAATKDGTTQLSVSVALAKRMIATGHSDEARILIRRVEEQLEIEDGTKGKRDIEYWRNQSEVGGLLVAVGRTDDGYRRIRRAQEELHRFITRSLPHLSLQEQLSFLANTYHPQLIRAIAITLKANTDKTTNVCEWLVNGKARTAETLATQSRYLVDPNGQSELTIKLRAAQWKLASLSSQPESPETTAQIRVLNDRLELLSREVGGVAKPVESRWISQAEFAAAIPNGAAYVDFFRVTDGVDSPIYVALVVFRGKLAAVDLGAAEPIDTAIREARELVGRAPKDLESMGAGKATAQINETLARLETLTLGRLQKPLEGAEQLILCPDGPLWLAPWAAFYSKSDKKHLIQRYELQFVTSGRSLLNGKQTSKEPLGRPVVIADPNYDTKREATLEPLEVVDDMPSEASYALRSSTATRQLPPTVTDLPKTRGEALAIAPAIERLTGQAPTVFLGDEAVEAACRDVSRPAILHIATHGFFLASPKGAEAANQHPLLQSGLLFAGYNHRHTGEIIDRNDAVLTALELLGSDFRGTDLVVLSACDTGVGDAQTGEGVLGLRQVFEISGARSIVSTLWSIDDAESARLMTSFYEHLTDGKSKAAALRAAQLERIAAIEERYGAAHPMFWAAFTVTGSPDLNMP